MSKEPGRTKPVSPHQARREGLGRLYETEEQGDVIADEEVRSEAGEVEVKMRPSPDQPTERELE